VDGNIFKVLRNENWNKIYKTKIIKDYNIKFTPDLGGEDLNFNLKYYPFVKKFKKIFSKTYYWRRKKKDYIILLNIILVEINYFLKV